MAVDKPSVVILGGCGFYGRHLVKFLVENELASTIKIADKTLPALAKLTDELKAIYKNKELVSFRQCDLAKEDHIKRIFDGTTQYDYVFNCCGETRMGMDKQDYELKNTKTAERCSKAAEAANVKKWIEVSDARLWDDKKIKATEKMKPKNAWTMCSAARLAAEEIIKTRKNLPWCILRPVVTYGPGCKGNIMARTVIGAVYQKNRECMKTLWSKGMMVNTVHIRDVVRAMWLCATSEKSTGNTYHLADQGYTTQVKLTDMLGKIFKIKTGFTNGAINMAAKMSIGMVTNTVNEKHVPAWSNLCMDHDVLNTPLSPFLDEEILKKHYMYVDGTLIMKELGFKYDHPEITIDLVKEVIEKYKKQGFFPDVPLYG